jgi:dephospho-CoA kinase
MPGKVIGLTGGIASGKSLVAGIFRELGAHVIDADAVAREVAAPGTDALSEIVETFGPSALQADGTLDRKLLASRIFSDPQARARLNAITHPRIRRRIAEMIESLRAARPESIILVDIPLLLDAAPRDAYPLDGIAVVAVDEATQRARLIARDRVTEAAARQRLQSQRPLREKIPLADWVIDNSGPPEATRRQVEALWRTWTSSRT